MLAIVAIGIGMISVWSHGRKYISPFTLFIRNAFEGWNKLVDLDRPGLPDAFDDEC